MSNVTVESEVMVLGFLYTLHHPVARPAAAMVSKAMVDQRDALDDGQRRQVWTDIHNAIGNGRPRPADEIARIQRVAEAMK